MRHLADHRAASPVLPPFGVWLRGVVEFLALARSRWSRRMRQQPRA